MMAKPLCFLIIQLFETLLADSLSPSCHTGQGMGQGPGGSQFIDMPYNPTSQLYKGSLNEALCLQGKFNWISLQLATIQ